MQKALIGILTATTVALAILCVVQWKQLRAGKEQMLATEEAWRAESEIREAQSRQVKQLERTKERLDQQVQEFTTVTTMLRANEARQISNLTAIAKRGRATGQQGAGGETSAPPGDSKDGLFGKGMGDMITKMMKDPSMREMMRGQQKAAINMMYSGFFKEMNLSPEEKEKFTGILADAQLKNIEHTRGMFGEQQEAAGADTQKLLTDAKKQTDADIKALLGDERFAQYEDYRRMLANGCNSTSSRAAWKRRMCPCRISRWRNCSRS